MPPNVLIAMMGLPRSGKTTIARTLGCPIVNPDMIRLAIHGKPFIPEAEGSVWAVAMLMVKYFFLMGHNTVVFDATNTTYVRRDALQSSCWTTEFYEINTHVEDCKKRAYDGNRLDLVPIITRMDEGYQFLTPSEDRHHPVKEQS